jgi:hypothetical protein
VAFRVPRPDDFTWPTRPHEPDEPARHDVPTGGLVRVDPGTPLQAANHGDVDLVVYAHGLPPEHERAEVLESALQS